MKISAVIISYNAAKTIGQCLQSLQPVADEIIVIDSFSNDETAQICNNYSAVFIQRKFTGYGDQKNFGIGQAKHSYILSLDADEYLSSSLQASIKNLKQWNKNIGLWNLAKVHEKVEFNQKVEIEFLKGTIIHQYHHTKKTLIARNNTYARLGAQNLLEAGKKSSRLTIFIKQTFAFIKAYFLKLGFLDFALGFELAKEHSRHVGLKYRILLQIQQQK